jgi:hypothetical protein
MGLLRNFTGTARNRIKGIAKARKFPGAIAEMKKLLAAKGTATKPAPKSPAGHKLHLSPQRKVQLKLQGVYIGMMRSLPVAEKAKIKAVAKEKGMAAAIEVMRRLPRRTQAAARHPLALDTGRRGASIVSASPRYSRRPPRRYRSLSS